MLKLIDDDHLKPQDKTVFYRDTFSNIAYVVTKQQHEYFAYYDTVFQTIHSDIDYIHTNIHTYMFLLLLKLVKTQASTITIN